MTTSPATTPTEVRAPVGSEATEIVWLDGHVSHYPNDLLRGYCPCAGCQGHQGDIRFIQGGNARIDGIEEMGNYALCFTWGDGHASGIYAFTYLRTLCACPKCFPGSVVERKEAFSR